MLLSVLLAVSASAGGVVLPVDEEVSFRIELATQTRVDLRSSDEENSADLRVSRMRPMLHLDTASGAVHGFFHAQVWPDRVELLDVFFDARLHESGWSTRFGVLKLPFTVYRQRAWFSLPLTEWSHTARALGSERQIGAQVSGPSGDLHWTFGVFSGQNVRAAHAIRLPALYGEPVSSRMDLLSSEGIGARLHPEFFFQVASFGQDFNPREGRERTGKGPLSFGGALSLAADARPVHRQDFVARAAVEAMMQGHGLGIHAVGYTSVAPLQEGLGPGLSGALFEGSLRIGPRLELALRAAGVWTSSELLDDALKWQGQDPAGAVVTPWSSELELGLGWNILLPDPRRSIMLEVQQRRLSFPALAPQDSLLFRSQLQLLF